MSIAIDKSASLEQIKSIWKKFKEHKEFAKFSSEPDKIYWRSVVQLSSKANDFEFLKEFGKVRKQIVDKIISMAFMKAADIKHCLSCETCVARSVGSNDPTSDYDITITGYSSYLIVKQFYLIFRNIFHAESGDIFDTNVYGGPTEFTLWDTTTLEKIDNDNLYKKVYMQIEKNKSILRTFRTDQGFLTTLQRKENEKPTEYCTSKTNSHCYWSPTPLCTLERCWAFLAFFRFLHDRAFKEFAENQFSIYAKKSLEDFENYLSLLRALDADTAEYQKLALNETCSAQPKPSMLKMCFMTNYYITLVDRSNDAEKKLYQAIVDGKASDEQLVALRNNLKNSIAHSNLYASEIYVTSGAVYHIVLATQMKLDLPQLLQTNDLFASFLENCGFAFHVFEETKPLTKFVDGPFCIAALINGSKYLGRLLDALYRFKPCKELSIAIEKVAFVRAQYRGHTETVDPTQATELFWQIVEKAEIFEKSTRTCLRNQFLRQYLQWIAKKTNEYYS